MYYVRRPAKDRLNRDHTKDCIPDYPDEPPNVLVLICQTSVVKYNDVVVEAAIVLRYLRPTNTGSDPPGETLALPWQCAAAPSALARVR